MIFFSNGTIPVLTNTRPQTQQSKLLNEILTFIRWVYNLSKNLKLLVSITEILFTGTFLKILIKLKHFIKKVIKKEIPKNSIVKLKLIKSDQ